MRKPPPDAEELQRRRAAHNARQRRYRAQARAGAAARYFRGKRKMSDAQKRRVGQWSKDRWASGKPMGRKRTMSRNAAARLRYAKRADMIVRTRRRSPIERDARNAGASIIGEKELRRPTFVVITPQGRRIETLEPDLA